MEELSRSQRKKIKTYNAILETSRLLFAEKGYSNTTIKDITDSCDIGYGTFYLHFNNKDEVLIAIAKEFSESLVSYKDDAKDRNLSVRERMYRGTREILRYVNDNKTFIKAVLSITSQEEGHEAVEDIWNAITERFYADHMYFAKKGYLKDDIQPKTKSWMVYTWSLKGLIEGIVGNEVTSEEIDKISRTYADMNYFTTIREECQQ